MPSRPLPTVVLVGRTNVGKSTLFNRLVEHKKALVSDVAGTTRDRKEGECLWRGEMVRIIDTGGLDVDPADRIDYDTMKQAEAAIEMADVIIFVLDITTGPLPQEYQLAEQLRSSGKPVLVVANKAETSHAHLSVEGAEWRLEGLPTPMPISALKGNGVGDLLDVVWDLLKDMGKPPREYAPPKYPRISLIGRPNVGKSSLLNAILGEERFIVSPIAHTTREPNDTLVEVNGNSYVLIDTAGMRKKGKVRKAGGLEAAGVRRTESVLKVTDVALLVIDANEPIGNQERTLAGMLKEADVGIIVVVNKWDLVPDKTSRTMKEYREYIAGMIPFLRWAPTIFVSAKTSQRVHTIFDLVDKVQENRKRTIPRKELEEFWKEAVKQHRPSRHKGPKHPRIFDIKQVGNLPPSFQITVRAKRADVLHPSYVRFLENRLRETFDFQGTPIRMNVRGLGDV